MKAFGETAAERAAAWAKTARCAAEAAATRRGERGDRSGYERFEIGGVVTYAKSYDQAYNNVAFRNGTRGWWK